MTSLGTTIGGRYRVTRPLGRGGMAEVWEARDEVLGRRVAVKMFQTGDDADSRRAAAEMHTLAALAHPGLVTVYDAGTDGDRTFLVMELVDGQTLADRVERGPLDRVEAATLGAQVASGLAYIHQRGIVHRDVKPANILLPNRDHDDAPVAKLADFGIAQHVGAERLTQTGTTIGTAAYLAPEQVTGRGVTPAADVYALGLVLLEALGHKPAWTGSPVEIALARLSNTPAVPDSLGPTFAPLLRAMVQTDPEARPPAARVRETLTQATTGTRTLDTFDATTVLPAAGAGATRVLPAAAARPAGPMPPVRGPRTEVVAAPLPVAPERRRRRGLLALLLALGLGVVAVLIGLAVAGGSGTSPTGSTSPTAGTSAPASSDPATSAAATSEAPSSDPATSDSPSTNPATSDAATTPTQPTQPAGPGGGNGNGGPGAGGGPGNGGGPGGDKTKPGKP